MNTHKTSGFQKRKMESDHVTWSRIDSISQKLAEKIQKLNREFYSISTITRGGLVPARLLADRLGIEKIFVDENKIPLDSLFVDDIYDSGDTFKKVLSKAEDPNRLVYSTLFARKGKRYPKQLVYVQETAGTEYIVFPWDRFEHKKMKKFQK